MSDMTVREFFERQRDTSNVSAYLGRDCCIVQSGGFFLLNTPRFVEVIPGDEALDSVLTKADDFFDEDNFDWPGNSGRNDSFGSRKRAPITTNDGLRNWTLAQIMEGRSPKFIESELRAAGVNCAGARTLIAVALWRRANPTSGAVPDQNDIASFVEMLDATDITADDGPQEGHPDAHDSSEEAEERSRLTLLEQSWREEALRKFPGHAWTGREAEWIESYVNYKRKEARSQEDAEKLGWIGAEIHKRRKFFSRKRTIRGQIVGGDFYRAILYIETIAALGIAYWPELAELEQIRWPRDPQARLSWAVVALKAVCFVTLFHYAHWAGEAAIRAEEQRRGW